MIVSMGHAISKRNQLHKIWRRIGNEIKSEQSTLWLMYAQSACVIKSWVRCVRGSG